MNITQAHWVFLDTETTGLKPKEGAQIIELGWCTVKNMTIEGSADHLIDPGQPIPERITQITHITDEMVRGQPSFREVAAKFLPEFQEADFIAAYNKDFDRDMLKAEFQRIGVALPEKIWLDPLTWARAFIEGQAGNKLATIAQQFNVSLENAHRADADAKAAAQILIKFFEWGVDEANFPDDVAALKELERGWRRAYRAKQNIMNPLRDPKTRKVTFTGTPGELPNVADGVQRQANEYMYRLLREKWGRLK